MPILTLPELEWVISSRRTKSIGRLVLNIPAIPVETSLRWERELNTAFQECGCVLGSQGGFLGGCPRIPTKN